MTILQRHKWQKRLIAAGLCALLGLSFYMASQAVKMVERPEGDVTLTRASDDIIYSFPSFEYLKAGGPFSINWGQEKWECKPVTP